MDIKIAYLKDHSDKIPMLSKIWHEVLGSIWISDISIEQDDLVLWFTKDIS